MKLQLNALFTHLQKNTIKVDSVSNWFSCLYAINQIIYKVLTKQYYFNYCIELNIFRKRLFLASGYSLRDVHIIYLSWILIEFPFTSWRIKVWLKYATSIIVNKPYKRI